MLVIKCESKLKQDTDVPKYYYSGSRKGQILHLRLKTNSSSLNHHLFSRNITDNDICLCVHVEDTGHFLTVLDSSINDK